MAPRRRNTILVVDDTALLRELAALFLSRAGRVLKAACADEALAIAREARPDLVVADLEMPGVDGAVLCHQLKTDPLLRDIPVVMLSGSDLAQDRARAVRAGADDVLPKPLERVALLDAARRFLTEAGPRGLPRIDLECPVELHDDSDCWPGVALNLSRNGLFVQTQRVVAARRELALAMTLPDTAQKFQSTAQVVWTRAADEELGSGMGLRFVALDGHNSRALWEYVGERVPVQPVSWGDFA